MLAASSRHEPIDWLGQLFPERRGKLLEVFIVITEVWYDQIINSKPTDYMELVATTGFRLQTYRPDKFAWLTVLTCTVGTVPHLSLVPANY